MPDKQTVVLNQNLHPHAEDRLREHTDDFHASLALQAKVLAFKEKADLVLSAHVEEARRMIVSKKRDAWRQEISTIVGGAFFGAFLSGFITALPAGDKLAIVIYTTLGFVGMFLVFWGIKK
ncbi:hypothetical protein L0337_14380 [candidate division KSB1 bacterium]|nr:hypothetical protein [candidate division KSB1 bacterium]